VRIAIAATAVTVARERTVIVGASVAAKWVMQEPHSDVAQQILDSGMELAAPAHWLGEATNAIWAATRRGDLNGQEAEERTGVLAEAPIETVALNRLAAAAMTIGLRIGVTIYDALYLALAVERAAVLVTDDQCLLRAARRDREVRNLVIGIADSAARALSRGHT
jgi:predicted nucleic acid-binding protein